MQYDGKTVFLNLYVTRGMGLRDHPMNGCVCVCVCVCVCYFQHFVDVCIFNQGPVKHLSH